MPSQWYYAEGDHQRGPVGEEQLRQMLSSGQLAPSHLVWRQGLPAWAPAGTLVELGGDPASVPQSLAYPLSPQINYYNPAGGAHAFAGFWIRFGAYLIDSIILWVPNRMIGAGIQYA